MPSSLAESGAELANAFDEFLEQYTPLQLAGGPVTPTPDRVAVHSCMPQLVMSAAAVLIQLLKRAPAGMTMREFLARWIAGCPAGVCFKKEFQEYAEDIRTRFPGSSMDNGCDHMARMLGWPVRNAETLSNERCVGNQSVFQFPPKQRALLKTLHLRGKVPEQRVLARVYPYERKEVRRVILKARLRKLFRDTNENLLSLGLSKIERERHRQKDSLLSWPHQGRIP
jgi:hypothetical protein